MPADAVESRPATTEVLQCRAAAAKELAIHSTVLQQCCADSIKCVNGQGRPAHHSLFPCCSCKLGPQCDTLRATSCSTHSVSPCMPAWSFISSGQVPTLPPPKAHRPLWAQMCSY